MVAYIIFSDAALMDMCRIRPTTSEEFLTVSGVGRRKAEKYGDAFCSLISEHLKSNPDEEKAPENEVSPLQKQLDSFREMTASNRRSAVPRAWTDEEERQLSEEFSQGMTIAEIGRAHKRTAGAIRARLKKMNIIA